jgi:hypothetical protein
MKLFKLEEFHAYSASGLPNFWSYLHASVSLTPRIYSNRFALDIRLIHRSGRLYEHEKQQHLPVRFQVTFVVR